MNIPSLLNVAIGLFLVYLILSLLVSDLQELISAYLFDWRAKNLKSSIESILGTETARNLYEHPLIRSLKNHKMDRDKGAAGPSYIPDETFALALIGLLMEAAGLEEKIVVLSVQEFKEALASDGVRELLNPERIELMRSLANKAQIDCGKDPFIKSLECELIKWFQQSMDRASGVFKRRVKGMILVLGFGLAVLLNVDTLNLATRLSLEPVLREQVSRNVDFVLSENALSEYLNCLERASLEPKDCQSLVSPDFLNVAEWELLSLPLGWNSANLSYQFGEDFSSLKVLRAILGWTLTAIAISMGSSFWFDLLNRLIDVRNTGNKPPATIKFKSSKSSDSSHS
ncbi:MAG: hypothetical protein ACP5D7_00405 [Limnospira sp.]